MDMLSPIPYMLCGCVWKVREACDTINTLGCHLSRQKITQALVPDLAESAEPPCHPHGGGYCYTKKPHAMDVVPPIPYILCVNLKGLTSLGHNQYTGVSSI